MIYSENIDTLIFLKVKIKQLQTKILIFFLFYLIFKFSLKKNYINEKTLIKNNIDFNVNNLISYNKYYIDKYLKYFGYFNVTHIDYFFSFKYNIAKVEYRIGFYDNNNNIIIPSDLSLYNNLLIICHIKPNNDYFSIDSLPNIYQNKYFSCIEFFNLNEKINFGIKIYQINESIASSNILFFREKGFYYNNSIYKKDNLFDSLFINYNFISFFKRINNKKLNDNLKLKSSYIQYPFCILKREAVAINNEWSFKNIYNHYFCFCKGKNCLFSNINHYCKYYFYLHIIDNNRNIYPKTDYLFMDFIFANLSSDDVYPIFKEMEKLKFPVHYITEDINIYKNHCNQINKCLTILPVINEKNPINGDFLEKYLTIFLKLKIVVSGRGTTFNTNLFYNIEYITYICVGHGVCYFKEYLYSHNRIYGIKKNDKLLLPPSNKIIIIAKKYGWNDKNIIKMNLPRWDKYNNQSLFNSKDYIYSNSIFIMFTWRDIIKSKEISLYYFKNITNILKNEILNRHLIKNNITLYLSFHRLINIKYIKNYKKLCKNNIYIKFIEQNEISHCLSKTSLVVTDFSSIIFDLIYRKKPFIIYIPDSNDPQIKDIYTKDYYYLIESMKNGTINFENIYFNINDTINKIIYYINNNFIIEPKLEKFYESFGFKIGNNINKFIEYLKKI